MKIFIFIIISVISLSFGCKDEQPKLIDPPPPIVINDSALNALWKRPIGYRALSSFTCIYKDQVIFSISENQGSFYFRLISLNKTNGKEMWKSTQSFWIPSKFYQNDKTLYFESGGDVNAIDLSSGQIIWHVKRPENYSGDGSLSFIGGKLWYSWCIGDKYIGDSTILYSLDPVNGNLSKIHTWYNNKNDLHQLSFYRVGLWMHPKGDSILLLTSSSYNWNSNISKPDLIAWNINADSAYFDFRRYSGWDGIYDPLVINNALIVKDFSKVKSLNLITLNTNWDLDLPYENQTNGQLLYHSGLIMPELSTNRDAITWIDPISGKITNTLLGAGADNDGYYFKDNWLYFSSSHTIKKVDLIKHKIVWSFESPDDNRGDTFNWNMTLDAANDLIFITDKVNFYCFKINK